MMRSTGMRRVFFSVFIISTLFITLTCATNFKEKRETHRESFYRLSWKIKEKELTSYIANIELFPVFEKNQDSKKIQGKPKMVYKIPYILEATRTGEKEIEWEVQFGNMKFDTNIPFAVPPDARAIKRSIGKIRTDFYGNVLSMSGFEAFGLPEGAILPGMPVIVFPGKEIRVGETWGTRSRYRFEKIEDGKALLSYESEDPIASGKIWLDMNTGMLIRLEDTRKLKSEIEMEIKTTVHQQ